MTTTDAATFGATAEGGGAGFFALGALDHLARAIEQPFEDRVNDTAMSAISRTIEIDLRQMIADVGIPEPATPENGVLM